MKRTVLFLSIWLCVTGVGISQTPLCLGDNYYQKHMVKVFEALKSQKLDKVAKYWQEIEEKSKTDDSLNPMVPISRQLAPVWQLSEAMMMNTREGHGKLTNVVPFDPWSAYAELKNACSTPSACEIADRFLSHKNLQMSVAAIKADIEKNLVDTVRQINTEGAYDRLVDLLYDYPEMQTILKEREQLAYDKVRRTRVLADCQRYLDKYDRQNESHRIAIEWRRDSLAYEELGPDAAACKAYLANYPSSSFNHAVEQLLYRRALDELTPTVAACQEYARLYPESEYLDSVKTLEMNYAFNDAKESDNIGVYDNYLINYPDSPHFDKVQDLLRQRVKQRYLSPMVTLDDLQRFCCSDDELTGVDKNRIRSLYNNLLFLPTSAYMNDCDGLLGQVVMANSPDLLEGREVLIFNDQGLLVRRYDSRSGLNERYTYGFDPENGFTLLSKTDAKGHVVNYVTKWNEVGDILELAGSDGNIITFSRDIDYLKKVMHQKGRNVLRTDYYDRSYKLDKTVFNNNKTQSYWYNTEGDLALTCSEQGKAGNDSTTCRYGYTDGRSTGKLWNWKNQNNGKMQSIRYRQFNKTIAKASCCTDNTFKMDWNVAPQVPDTAALAALVAELDESLNYQIPSDGRGQASVAQVIVKPAEEVNQATQLADAVKHEEIGATPEETSSVTAVDDAVQAVTEAQGVRDDDESKQPLDKPDLADLPKGKEGLLSKLLSDMVYVEGGTFTMGATSEQEDDAWEIEYPAHRVKLSPFYICKYEVTQDLWEMVMGENPSHCKGTNHPVDMVSWDDCQQFIEKLNDMTGIAFRLPTEAEWEYAARGGKNTHRHMYAGSNELDEVAWYSENAKETSHSVGKKMPNELGLYDMSGNVWEWCDDWLNFYTNELQTDPIGNYSSQGHVQRGGCWNQGTNLCRVSFRGVCAPNLRASDTGLRLVATSLKRKS